MSPPEAARTTETQRDARWSGMGNVRSVGQTSSRSPMAAERARIDASVAWLRETMIRHGVEHAIEVRDHILTNYFDGSFSAFCDPSRNKPRSFRMLCEHVELPYERSTLNFQVRIGEQARDMPERFRSELSATHHRALLPIDDRDVKIELARKAVSGKLSVSELQILVRERRPKSKAGRPALPVVVKAGNAVAKSLATLEVPSADEVSRIADEERSVLAAALREGALRMKAVADALDPGECLLE